MSKIYSIILLSLVALSAGAQTRVVHYSFNSCSLNDSSGNGLHLTPGGSTPSPVCTTGAAGIANSARYFSGTNWYTTVRSSKLALNRFTLSAVINFKAFSTLTCQVNYMVASDGAQGGDSHYAIESNDNNIDGSCAIASGPDGQQFFGMSRNLPPAYNSYPMGNYLAIARWYCLTTTFDGTDIRTYIDGNHIYTKTWASATPAYASGNPFLYIATGFGGRQYYFDGRIDDVEIYDDVLPDSLITKYCTNVKTPPPPPPPPAGVGATQGADVNSVGMAYPNPVNNILTIPVFNINGPVKLSIFAMDGRLIAQKELNASGTSTELQLNTGALSQGTYILRVATGGDVISRCFTRQ